MHKNRSAWILPHLQNRSVFSFSRAKIELYMDDQLIKSTTYASFPDRIAISNEWEMWMRNMYKYHTFYVKIKPPISYKY